MPSLRSICLIVFTATCIFSVPKNLAADNSILPTISEDALYSVKKLKLDSAMKLVDSFDHTEIGTFFATKVSREDLLGNGDVDAVYLYLVEKLGNCALGLRVVGWIMDTDSHGNDPDTCDPRGRQYQCYLSSNKEFPKSLWINNVSTEYYPDQDGKIVFYDNTHPEFPSHACALMFKCSYGGMMSSIVYYPLPKHFDAMVNGDELTIYYSSWYPSHMTVNGKALQQLRLASQKCFH